MSEILNFAQTVSPLGVIALLAVVIILQLAKGKSVLSVIRGSTKKNVATLDTISCQLEKVANNHLHELPELSDNVRTIMQDQKDMNRELILQGNRITRVEALLEQK